MHSHGRTQNDGEIRPPDLHLLVRCCNERAIDFSQSGITMVPIAQAPALIARVPLTDEPWEPIAEGDVIALKDGLIRARRAAATSCPKKIGHTSGEHHSLGTCHTTAKTKDSFRGSADRGIKVHLALPSPKTSADTVSDGSQNSILADDNLLFVLIQLPINFVP